MKIPVYQLDWKLPTQTSNDLPRALTEFGQQAEVSPSHRPVLGVAINQSAIALLGFFGRCLLKLDGENLVGLRRINFHHFRIPVQVAEANCSCGLKSRRGGLHGVIDQHIGAEAGRCFTSVQIQCVPRRFASLRDGRVFVTEVELTPQSCELRP